MNNNKNSFKMKETPSQLPLQSYLMNFPHTFSTNNPNNVWMEEMSGKELSINRPKAYKQFMDLYNFIAGQSLVHLFGACQHQYSIYQLMVEFLHQFFL